MAEVLVSLLSELRCPECDRWFGPGYFTGMTVPQHFAHTAQAYPCPGSNKSAAPTRKPPRPLGVPNTWDWKEDAKCDGENPSLFDNPFNIENAKAAIQICKGCPVIDHCYFYAKEDPYYEGIEGGFLWWSDLDPEKEVRGRTKTQETSTPQDSYASSRQLTIFGESETEDDS